MYRVAINFIWFIGFGVYYFPLPESNASSINIFLPFVKIFIGLGPDAKGFRFN